MAGQNSGRVLYLLKTDFYQVKILLFKIKMLTTTIILVFRVLRVKKGEFLSSQILIFLFSVFLLSYSWALPEPIAAMLKEEVNFTGPNCHNTSLRALGTLSYKRYVSEEEMSYVLTNYCTKLKEPSPNSLGVFVSQPEGVPFHSFIFLNNITVFTKNGLSKKAKPVVQGYEEMFVLHLTAYKNSCQIRDIKECDLDVSYYDCSKNIPGISSVERAAQNLLMNRQTMLDKNKQSGYADALRNFKVSENCIYEGLVLDSLSDTLKAATHATVTPSEQEQIEELRRQTADVLADLSCF